MKSESSESINIFRKIETDFGLEVADKIDTLFGGIALPDQLQILTEADEDTVFDIFYRDTKEIIYVTDNFGKVKGIVTFGEFIKNYGQRKSWIEPDFRYIVIDDLCIDGIESIKEIFDKYKKIKKVPVLDREGRVCFEIRSKSYINGKNDMRKQLLPFAKLRHYGIPCVFVRVPGFLESYSYTAEEQYRIENKLSFTKMQADVDRYENDLKNIIGKKFSREYVKKLSQIPGIIKDGERYRHADGNSELVNVVGGKRVVIGVPEQYDRILHVYGSCGVFGYAVEDVQTIPSELQRFCNQDEQRIRVESYGTWGTSAFIDNLLFDIQEGIIDQNDIVLVYAFIYAWNRKQELETIGISCYDTTEEFHKFLKEGHTFYEIPGHMTAEGYTFIASFIYERMKETGIFKTKNNFGKIDARQQKDLVPKIDDYLNEVKRQLPMKKLFQTNTGAIVMNCNPFTLGHRYLVEKALEHVDNLLLFIVEEDKSFFPFADRIEMVRQGTKNLPNVYVVPSGNYILSSITFPEYFLKEQRPEVIVDVTDDAKIFGRYIAPALHITVRFAGTEPLDKVTEQYHGFLRRYLGDYGIEFHEIPRRQIGGEYISASTVRKLLKRKEYEQVKKYVPETTFEYLKNMKDI